MPRISTWDPGVALLHQQKREVTLPAGYGHRARRRGHLKWESRQRLGLVSSRRRSQLSTRSPTGRRMPSRWWAAVLRQNERTRALLDDWQHLRYSDSCSFDGSIRCSFANAKFARHDACWCCPPTLLRTSFPFVSHRLQVLMLYYHSYISKHSSLQGPNMFIFILLMLLLYSICFAFLC